MVVRLPQPSTPTVYSRRWIPFHERALDRGLDEVAREHRPGRGGAVQIETPARERRLDGLGLLVRQQLLLGLAARRDDEGDCKGAESELLRHEDPPSPQRAGRAAVYDDRSMFFLVISRRSRVGGPLAPFRAAPPTAEEGWDASTGLGTTTASDPPADRGGDRGWLRQRAAETRRRDRHLGHGARRPRRAFRRAADQRDAVWDHLAREGASVTEARSPAPITLPAHASILTGRLPLHHGARDNGLFQVDPSIPTLAERFAEAGYDTAAFVSAAVLDARYGLTRGFAVYDDDVSQSATQQTVARRSADASVDLAIAWLRARDPDRPVFLWLHLYDAHRVWQAREPWASRVSAYRAAIAFVDDQTGRLLAALDEQRRLRAIPGRGHQRSWRGAGRARREHAFVLRLRQHVASAAAAVARPARRRSDGRWHARPRTRRADRPGADAVGAVRPARHRIGRPLPGAAARRRQRSAPGSCLSRASCRPSNMRRRRSSACSRARERSGSICRSANATSSRRIRSSSTTSTAPSETHRRAMRCSRTGPGRGRRTRTGSSPTRRRASSWRRWAM